MLFGFVKQIADFFLQFGVGLPGVPKLHFPKAVVIDAGDRFFQRAGILPVQIIGRGLAYRGLQHLLHKVIDDLLVVPAQILVVEFGENQFERFLEHVDAGIRQHLVFHFQNDAFQGFALLGQFVLEDQIFQGEALAEYVRKFLVDSRDVADFLKIVRVLAVIAGDFPAVRPHADLRAGCIAIGAQLVFPVLKRRFFDFNDDVGRIGTVFVKDDDVGLFRFPAKTDRVLKTHPAFGVAVFAHQPLRIELADDLFRFQLDFLVPDNALHIGARFAANGFLGSPRPQLRHIIIPKQLEMVVGVFEDGLENVRFCLHFCVPRLFGGWADFTRLSHKFRAGARLG